MAQEIICRRGSSVEIAGVIADRNVKNALLVCDASFPYLSVKETMECLPCELVKFDRFTSNPLYEDVCEGVELFRQKQCDAIIAVGGGSAIDVAKCIKLFSGMNPAKNYLGQDFRDTHIPLIAFPTTAGTGSESTRHAVIYFNGQKQSISHESIIPDYAVLDSSTLKTLPLYQKKCTMMDALCQGIESWWSVNSTDESIEYSKQAILLIAENLDNYIFENDEDAAEKIMLAANYSGRAINITQTTAPHAMSYKLTSMYGIPHGHAVAICLPEVWRYMICHPGNCIDNRGIAHLNRVFNGIASSMKVESPKQAIERLEMLLTMLGLERPHPANKCEDLTILVDSVNETRLKNNPVKIPKTSIKEIYDRII